MQVTLFRSPRDPSVRRASAWPISFHPWPGVGSDGLGRSVAMFGLAGVFALAVTGLGVTLAYRSTGESEAINDARTIADVVARGIVEPELTDAILAGDPEELARFDALVRSRALGRIVRVKVWRTDGQIAYSDEPRLIGATFELDEEEVAILGSNRSAASVSDLSAPENAYEDPDEPLLEVYQAVRTPSGQVALMESYLRYESVAASAEATWRSFLPALAVGLIALGLLQFPLAWSLARRVSLSNRDRLRSMERAADAANIERNQIAADLHDTVVQDLAGQRFSLLAAAAGQQDPRTSEALLVAARALGGSVKSLRTVVSELRPPILRQGGLAEALDELQTQFEDAGLTVITTIDPLPKLSERQEAAAFRVAREALRNAQKHSGSTRVWLSVTATRKLLNLTITDDGRGFDAETTLERPQLGHVGLQLLEAAARDAEAHLDISSAQGAGTTVILEIPL